MKALGGSLAMAAGLWLGGCTSVKLVQRDGCWVRRTERAGAVREDLGPCMTAPSPWAQDRLTRLVQECAVQVEHRWNTAALDAWSHGRAIPAREPGDSALQTCLGDALRTIVPENETLKARLTDVSGDRDALRARADRQEGRLQTSVDKLSEYLGEAAKKQGAPAYATATATSEGTQRSEPTAPAAASAPLVIATIPGSSPAVPRASSAACAPGRALDARSGRRPVTASRDRPCALPPAAGVTAAEAAPPGDAAGPAPAAQATSPAGAR